MADALQDVKAYPWDETERVIGYAPDTGYTFSRGDIAYFNNGKIRKLILSPGVKLPISTYVGTVFAGVVVGKSFSDTKDQKIYGGRVLVNTLSGSRSMWIRWADDLGAPAIPDDSVLGIAATLVGGNGEYSGAVVACPAGIDTGVLQFGRVTDYKVRIDRDGTQHGWVLIRVYGNRMGSVTP